MQRCLFFTSMFLISAFALCLLCCLAGARINISASYPKGLYWVVSKPPAKGDFVAFYLSDEMAHLGKQRGYLGIGAHGGFLIKRIMAVHADHVSITPAGVTINNVLVDNTIPLTADNLGRPMPVVRLNNYQLKENEFMLLSDFNPRSFDSRYFGIIHTSQIIDTVIPIFTW